MNQKTTSMPTRYAPQEIESHWYETWEKSGAFAPQGDGKPFTIVIPPPNVTGALHMGHALNNTIQDVLIRWKRKQGYRTLWQPGVDHAGIATQSVVEKQLAKDNIRRQDLGREKFMEKVWEWKNRYGDRIVHQLKRMGCSCDWSRLRFTMDEGLSKAVREVFVRLHEEGLIYRGTRLVNWCPQLQTALADEEVESRDTPGHFWHIKYPLADEPDQYITVSTTRPETLFGDTAVAVHPDDSRYKQWVGKHVRLPFINREIPIITDEHADPEKGTGAVKITPAHDFNDFEVGLRHQLEQINVMNPDATLNEEAGPFAGMNRFGARKKIVEELEKLGQLAGVDNQTIPIPYCYRSGDVVEPALMNQWYVKMKPLAEPAIAAVKEGRTRFVPERYAKTYFDWLEQFRDWCISRQIWWGHQIPVWYVVSTGDGDLAARVSAEDPIKVSPLMGLAAENKTPYVVARSVEDAQQKAEKEYGPGVVLRQEEDVLDTWFSSALWPFSTLGWPDATPELERHYPTDVLSTARDIIYFWVARMMFSGLKYMDKEPFHTVYIHGTILDEQGRRMSKSLGNGIDPIEMIEKYGADAVRFSLLTLTSEGQDIKLSPAKFEMGRNFANKLWNAVRFILPYCGEAGTALKEHPALDNGDPADTVLSMLHEEKLTLADKWILTRLNELIGEVDAALEHYRFADACNALYHFLWDDFCSLYLEYNKKRLMDNTDTEDRATVVYLFQDVLLKCLGLLHPFMPYVTEEIHKQLGHEDLLISSHWPQVNEARQFPAEKKAFAESLHVLEAVRSVRGAYSIPAQTKLKVRYTLDENKDLDNERDLDGDRNLDANQDRNTNRNLDAEQTTVIHNLENLESLERGDKPAFAAAEVFPGGQVFVTLEGILDKEAEREKLKKELDRAEKFITGLEKKLSNQGFLDKAPPDVVELEKTKLETQKSKRDKLRANLRELGN